MIKRLKQKFILLFTTSLFVLLALMVLCMNVMSYRSVINKADSTLQMLMKERPNTHLPSIEQKDPHHNDSLPGNTSPDGRAPEGTSPNAAREFQYFVVVYDADGNLQSVNLNNISSLEQQKACEYADGALKSGKTYGTVGSFRFAQTRRINEMRLYFLDCGRQFDSFRSFVYASCIVAFVVFIVTSLIAAFFAGRILKPIVESYAKQRRFITDAGHEIKTPLAVITANIDVLEYDIGKNECLEDIRQQTQRLTELTNELVYLSRMNETDNHLPMIDFPISDAVAEAAEAFRLPAQAQGKQFNCSIRSMLSAKGNYKAIQQLVSILTDNALKYSSEKGSIELSLERHGKYILLCIGNTVDSPLKHEELARIFDRFYRADPSRNSETGGYGIGLAVAKAIVTAHNGKIYAEMQGENIFKITVLLPMA